MTGKIQNKNVAINLSAEKLQTETKKQMKKPQ